ncbi:biofilm regulation diguanylate cyclase SiaD [Synechococcus sp. CCY9201]|uniref:biofilm regulation diguanylate cyclase SiaD n=1 Tax=Synechococcus sp. CCY9201 TaxID=174697 RepID=UPI002B214CC7|nr:biofilm regulation diguanylate cyclase SiaD [Synechococcus sp. CCY9201]MEA5473675.1 biofilm regulation diguanylate cyclase SiaD [Synechococcus sp. CCY9201]
MVRKEVDELELLIQQLLDDESHHGHPLHAALEQLWQRMAMQLAKLEHVTASDNSHSAASSEELSLMHRYDKQLRRLERVIKISDRYQAMLKDMNVSLKEAATHDQLTGIPNRRLMADRCRDEDERASRHGTTYCMAIFDADFFKAVNDTYGHDIGDQVLIKLASTLRRSMREYDLCARWGGEEFLALFVGSTATQSQEIVDRILLEVRNLSIPTDGHELRVTMSVGLAEHEPGETYIETFTRADTALYEAKQTGRNRCVFHRFEAS